MKAYGRITSACSYSLGGNAQTDLAGPWRIVAKELLINHPLSPSAQEVGRKSKEQNEKPMSVMSSHRFTKHL